MNCTKGIPENPNLTYKDKTFKHWYPAQSSIIFCMKKEHDSTSKCNSHTTRKSKKGMSENTSQDVPKNSHSGFYMVWNTGNTLVWDRQHKDPCDYEGTAV